MPRFILEKPAGIGKVMRGDKVIAKAGYSLEVSHDMISDGKGGYIQGLKNVYGQIQIMDGEFNLVDGKELSLKLADGRKWSFFAVRGDLVKRTFDCRESGPLE